MLVVVVMDARARDSNFEHVGCNIDVIMRREPTLNVNFPLAQRKLSVSKCFLTVVRPRGSSASVLTPCPSEKRRSLANYTV